MAVKHVIAPPDATEQRHVIEVGSITQEMLAPGVGGAITVTDGTTSVADVTKLTTDGATVTPGGAGEAIVTVTMLDHPILDPGNAWVPNTAVGQGYRIVSGGTHVWQANHAGTTGSRDPSGYFNDPNDGASTIIEKNLNAGTSVTWVFVGEVGEYPQEVANDAGTVGYLDAAGTEIVASIGAAVVGHGSATTYANALVNSGNGNATNNIWAGVDGDGIALSDAHAEVGTSSFVVTGHAAGRFDAQATAPGPVTHRSGWNPYADATSAHSGFDDGAGIGPNGTPATPGMALVADEDGYPRWTAGMPTADEKAALDATPTPLTALNPVASVADIPKAAYVDPASLTFAADLVAALQAVGLMAATPH